MNLRGCARNRQAMSHNVLIEIVSDVVCPWCYIGKRRMEKALTMLQRSDIELQWRAFDLNAGTPKGGVPWQAHMIRKFGSLAYARRLEAHVAAAATEDGITLRFDRIERLPKTLDAHRLIWLARTRRNAARPRGAACTMPIS
jgi:predicted DsbA family dithiol-disulfide isomerase